jgi:hypothetical protein
MMSTDEGRALRARQNYWGSDGLLLARSRSGVSNDDGPLRDEPLGEGLLGAVPPDVGDVDPVLPGEPLQVSQVPVDSPVASEISRVLGR